MSRHKLVRAMSMAVVLAGSAIALSYSAREATAQETHCYLVVCVGNVCTYQEIKCPETKPEETPQNPPPAQP